MDRLRRRVLLAGMLGSPLLGGTIAALSLAQYAFMRSLGWHPLAAPTVDWPSGLALGPYGWAMDVAFVVGGSLMAVFGHGVGRLLASGSAAPPRALSIGGALLACAGAGLALLAFHTDPTNLPWPRTWHGAIHDAAYVALGLALLPGMALLALGMRRAGRPGLALYTALTLAAAVPGFIIKGWLFYVFLVALLAWFPIVAWRAAGETR